MPRGLEFSENLISYAEEGRFREFLPKLNYLKLKEETDKKLKFERILYLFLGLVLGYASSFLILSYGERSSMPMKGFEYIIAVFLIVAILNALLNRFKEKRNDALKQGHSSLASIIRGIAYVSMGICGAIFFGILIYNAGSLVESIGLFWSLVLTIILILIFVLGWAWLAKWVFDKKP